jgi:hypothetical protein
VRARLHRPRLRITGWLRSLPPRAPSPPPYLDRGQAVNTCRPSNFAFCLINSCFASALLTAVGLVRPLPSPIMSLFGTSPEDASTAAQDKPRSSLFSEPDKGNADLFADDVNDAADDSPWGGMPTPKKGGTREAIKMLLATDDVPEGYIDTFDALVASGEGIGGGVSVKGAKKVLEHSSLGTAATERISRLVLADREDESALTRSEFNVVLALVGLAQEGEEVTLDGVDERKRGRGMSPMTPDHDWPPSPPIARIDTNLRATCRSPRADPQARLCPQPSKGYPRHTAHFIGTATATVDSDADPASHHAQAVLWLPRKRPMGQPIAE